MEEDKFHADKMSLVRPKGWPHVEKLERGLDWSRELGDGRAFAVTGKGEVGMRRGWGPGHPQLDCQEEVKLEREEKEQQSPSGKRRK